MPANNYELLDKGGYTSVVYLIPGTHRVCKSFLPKCVKHHFPAEVEAYERFRARGHPATILEYYGVDKNDPAGIILELAQNGTLHEHLWDGRIVKRKSPSQDMLYRWARQAAEGLAFAHSCGVLHSDIHCVNFLLDANLDLKVADFAGASIEGSKSWSFYRITHQLPGADGESITIASEIFGFGSALFNMVTGHDVFEPELQYDRDEEEIIRRLRSKEFPDTSELPVLGSVITKCWNLKYQSMVDIVEDLNAERPPTADVATTARAAEGTS